jgi:hypothetical protein
MPPGLLPRCVPGVRIRTVLPMAMMVALRNRTVVDESSERPSFGCGTPVATAGKAVIV